MPHSSPGVDSPADRLVTPEPADQWLETSRREILRIVEDCRRDIAKREQAQTAISPRRRAILEAVAKCMVLRHSRPLMAPLDLLPFWEGPGRFPTSSAMKGCMKAAKSTVAQLELDAKVAPWTGSFWHGLRLSGALVMHGGYPRLRAGRPWLAEDLERLPFPGHLSPPDHQGRRWLVRCHAWRLPVTELYGPDVLAGLLAGARREVQADGTWLLLPRTESVMNLLGWWKLCVFPGSKAGELQVSPFYGALLASYMSVACGMSMHVRRAGGCPLLPMTIYNALWGPGGADEGYLLPPKAGLLPFLCSHPTRARRGWDREFLYQASVRLGVAHVPLEQRRLLEEWRSLNRRLN
jgi:hypothetical protein